MKYSLIIALIIIISALYSNKIYSQAVGNVTGIQVSGNTLQLQCGTDVVVFRVCTENVIMVNLRPNGIESPDTLIVSNTTWTSVLSSIDTTGDPINIQTSNYKIKINRSPMRIHGYNSSGGLLFYEPAVAGITPAGISLTTTGGNFYGIHNHNSGGLTAQSGSVYSGSQGQAGAPFIWTTNGWGMLADMESGQINQSSNSITFTRNTNPQKVDIEFYFIFGSPKDIMNGMTDVTGKPPLFPKFSLGFLNSQWGMDQNKLLGYVSTYRSKGIPLDAYILDFDWMDWGADNYGEFRFGQNFPSASGGVIRDTLLKSGVKLFGIRKPRVHTFTVEGQYAISQHYFVDSTTDYFSHKTVGRMNFNIPGARHWFYENFLDQNSYSNGIVGYWNDEADEYGNNFNFMQMQRTMYEGQRKSNNIRVWSLNRNYFLGAQRYAYGHWSGDINTGFPSMQSQSVFMVSSILLGSAWWSMDVGGYNGTPNSENYYRWMQFGAFVPIFRVHGTLNQQREPWFYGTEAEQISVKYIKLRYKLLPYIYSAAWENHLSGVSIARPLLMEYPDDASVANMSDEWMFGNDILVKPVLSQSASSVSVYLPQGKWVDYWTGNIYNGISNLNYSVDHSTIPVFVKAGSVIPTAPVGNYSNDPSIQNLITLSCYPNGNGSGYVYEDDGETFNYENGSYAITSFSQYCSNNYTDLIINSRIGSFTPPVRDYLAEFNFMKSSPDSIILNNSLLNKTSITALLNSSVTAWAYDSANVKGYVRLHDNGRSATIRVYRNNLLAVKPVAPPTSFTLYQNYPNPFNPTTEIRFTIPERAVVSIKVYDITGREVSILLNQEKEAGTYYTSFNGSSLANGVYLCRLSAGKYTTLIKMILLK